MARRLQPKQLDRREVAKISIASFAASNATSDFVSSEIAALLLTAGNEGVAVDNTISTQYSEVGVLVDSGRNRAQIVDSTTNGAIAINDATDEKDYELYGRLVGFAGAVTTATFAGGTVTIDTAAAHGLTTGDEVTIEGAVEGDYNGTFTVTVTGASQFTYTIGGTPSSPATGTITFASYSLEYYYLRDNGTETAVTMAGTETIDFIIHYNFELQDKPYDAETVVRSIVISEDIGGSSGVGTFIEAEKVDVTALNTLEALDNAPITGTKVALFVNGSRYFEGVHFTRSGTAITWTYTAGSPEFGFNLKTDDDVYVDYRAN